MNWASWLTHGSSFQSRQRKKRKSHDDGHWGDFVGQPLHTCVYITSIIVDDKSVVVFPLAEILVFLFPLLHSCRDSGLCTGLGRGGGTGSHCVALIRSH